jgi:hypothetical protein
MADAPAYRFVYEQLLRYPGIVTLLDRSLIHFHCWYARQPGVRAEHLRLEAEQEYEVGDAGRPLLLSLLPFWQTHPPTLPEHLRAHRLWLTNRLLRASLGVVFPDRRSWAEALARAPDCAGKLTVIPAGPSGPGMAGWYAALIEHCSGRRSWKVGLAAAG